MFIWIVRHFVEQQKVAFESMKSSLLKQKDQLVSTIISNSQQRLIFDEIDPIDSKETFTPYVSDTTSHPPNVYTKPSQKSSTNEGDIIKSIINAS